MVSFTNCDNCDSRCTFQPLQAGRLAVVQRRSFPKHLLLSRGSSLCLHNPVIHTRVVHKTHPLPPPPPPLHPTAQTDRTATRLTTHLTLLSKPTSTHTHTGRLLDTTRRTGHCRLPRDSHGQGIKIDSYNGGSSSASNL